MEVPSAAKGHLYPSERTLRCLVFHPCLITRKCQNYNQHQHECVLCERRVFPQENLGGLIADGAFVPDIQDAVRVIQDSTHRKMFDPDADPSYSNDEGIDIVQQSRLKEATQLLSSINPGSRPLVDAVKEDAIKVHLTKEQASKYGQYLDQS